jgi:hypothetical protein
MDTPGIHGAELSGGDEPTVEIPVPVPAVEPSPELHSPQVRRLLFAGMALALLVLGGLVIGSLDDRRPAASPVTAVPPAAAPPVGDRGFELVSSAAAVTVRTADLGDQLYRINGPAPLATDDGTRLRLVLLDRTGTVDLVLADRVRWDLIVGGGADRKRIDLAGGRFRGISLHDGANQVELRLPRPDGTLTVTLAGGAGRFDVHTAGPVPVRVRVGRGAGQVVLRGETHSGVAAGALFTPEKWDAAGDRIDLDATAGMNLLTVLS